MNTWDFIKLKSFCTTKEMVAKLKRQPTMSLKGRSSKQNIKEILELNHTIDQMDLADVYRIFYPTPTQYTFFSAPHEPCLN
jgi:exonuclease III